MITGKRVIRRMSHEEMDNVCHEWAWLKDYTLDTQVEGNSKQARSDTPENESAAGCDDLFLSRSKRPRAQEAWSPPEQQEDQRPEENESISAKDHDGIEPGNVAGVPIHLDKEAIVFLYNP